MRKKIEPHKGGAAFLLGMLLPNVIGAIILAVVAAVVSASSGMDIQDALSSAPVTFVGLVVTQAFMLLAVLLTTSFGKDFKEGCNLKMPENKLDLVFGAIIAVGVIFGLNFLAEIFFEFLGLFGYTPTESPFPDMTVTSNFLLGIVIIAMMPAFCEEMLFRGVIMNSLLNKGKWTAILLSALFFTLMHASPLQTVYQFALGVIMAIVAFKSRSVVTTMLIHFLNNFLAIFMEFIGLGSFEIPWYLTVIGLLFVAVGLYYFLKKPDEELKNAEISIERLSEDDRANGLLLEEKKRTERINAILAVIFYGLATVACVSVWITQFIQGL